MKIALVENFSSDFYGARMRYALFLKEKGHDVVAIVPNDGFADKIREAGIRTIDLDIDIRNRSLKTVRIYSRELRKVFKQEQFDVVHLYRMQPNFVGTATAYFSLKKTKIINHITGLGIAFTNKSFKYRLMQVFIKTIYRLNYHIFGVTLILQNEEDKAEIGNKKEFLVVKGSSVNEERFNLSVATNSSLKSELQMKDGTTLIFVSRLLKQKGLTYLIEALQKFNKESSISKLNLIVAGWIDPNNPDSFTEKEIEELKKVDRVHFLGRRSDIDQLISISDIATLPTFYREGTPRFLLEAMAMGKPILTTDMPGCNHLIKNNTNGYLAEPKDIESLLKAFEFLQNSNLEEMGMKSRKLYTEEFSEAIVFNQLLDSYQS